ncbi:hypothetical protein HN587_06070 [Candidatus Woesearchaeota archaeon]|jgi:hypothetical protein|nr:hypothetical protein [Candidatus Woesearchaeota archaeon]
MDWFKIDLKKQNLLIFLVAAFIIFLLLPYAGRFANNEPLMIGSEPYYHARLAQSLIDYDRVSPDKLDIIQSLPSIQDSAFHSRNMYFSFYHVFLALFGFIFSLKYISILLPLIFGILSLFIFNKILISFEFPKFTRQIILIFLVISPAFVYLFSFSNPHSIIIFLTLLGFYLFIQEGKMFLILSTIIFGFVAAFTLFNSAVVVLLLLAYVFYTGKKLDWFLISSFVVGLISFSVQPPYFLNYLFNHSSDFFIGLNSDLGGVAGFGSFTILLACMGVLLYWKHKNQFLIFFIAALLLLFANFIVGVSANFYISFFVAVSAGMAFVMLYEREWKVDFVKQLSIFLIILGLLFSSVSFMNRVTNFEPSSETIDALTFLENASDAHSVVLSHYDNGYWIESISKRVAFADSFSGSNYDQSFLLKVSETIFENRDLETAKTLLTQYGINYIYIDETMTDGKVWIKPDEGLLFLLRNKETFENIYSKQGIKIWKVLITTEN